MMGSMAMEACDQPIGQDLLARRERAETFGAYLHEAGGTDAVDQRAAGRLILGRCERCESQQKH